MKKMFSLTKSLLLGGRRVKLSSIEFATLMRLRMKRMGLTGTALMDDLGRLFGEAWSPKSGTMYPLLARLSSKNLVSFREEKSPLGPSMKVYKITDDGKDIIDIAIVKNFANEMEFFANYLEYLMDAMVYGAKEGVAGDVHLASFGERVQELIDRLEQLKDKLKEKREEIISATEMTCKGCGGEIVDYARFCPHCGVELKA